MEEIYKKCLVGRSPLGFKLSEMKMYDYNFYNLYEHISIDILIKINSLLYNKLKHDSIRFIAFDEVEYIFSIIIDYNNKKIYIYNIDNWNVKIDLIDLVSKTGCIATVLIMGQELKYLLQGYFKHFGY